MEQSVLGKRSSALCEITMGRLWVEQPWKLWLVERVLLNNNAIIWQGIVPATQKFRFIGIFKVDLDWRKYLNLARQLQTRPPNSTPAIASFK